MCKILFSFYLFIVGFILTLFLQYADAGYS